MSSSLLFPECCLGFGTYFPAFISVMLLSLLVLPVPCWSIYGALDQPVENNSFAGANLLALGFAGYVSTRCRFRLYPFSSKELLDVCA
jgi:hypothetical protein